MELTSCHSQVGITLFSKPVVAEDYFHHQQILSFNTGWLSHPKAGQEGHTWVQVSCNSCPRSTHQHLREPEQTALKPACSNGSSLQGTGSKFPVRGSHTGRDTRSQSESGSFGLAVGRAGSPLLTVTLWSALLPATAYKGFVFCSGRKWLLLDCCKPILLKDILFVLIL